LNRVVEDGVTVPQVEPLNEITGAELFTARSYCGVLLLPCGGCLVAAAFKPKEK
jgi:hypothetical protein